MSDIYQTAQEFKARLAAGERAAAGELLRAYRLAVQRIEARIAELMSQLAAAKVQGEISASWLHERDRLNSLRREILVEIGRFSQVASLRVAAEQRAAEQLGTQAAQVLVGEATGDAVRVRFGALNRAAVQAAIGFAGDGSPLRALFAERGAQVAQGVTDELVVGVAQGAHPRVIARRIRQVTGGELARALTIARTETLRSYRAATHATYTTHGDVLRGWYWQASLSARTCAMCIAMHGRVFPLSARLQSHPCCRCVAVPVTLAAPNPETGAEWFAEQTPSLQRSVLGVEAYKLFTSGKATLHDFVGRRSDARWGETRYQRSVREILARAAGSQ